MKSHTRKGFLVAGLSLGVLLFWKWNWRSKTQTKRTVKLLDHNGRLVEVDQDKLLATKHTATNEEVQNWIKRN